MSEAGTRNAVIRASFDDQAAACAALGSPFTARLCRLLGTRLDEENAVGRRILSWPGDPSGKHDALALRLAGALHALVLAGTNPALAACYPPADASDDALWAACRNAFETDEAFLLERLLSPPQTNEVRRSGALLPGFLTIAALCGKPLVLSEVGASAGLNLQWDRYAYRLGQSSWAIANSDILIAPDWSGPEPEMANIQVIDRAGCDLRPVDPADAQERLRLLSYIWADQADRIERTGKSLALASERPLPVEQADAVEWLEQRLSMPIPGAAHVVYHSIVWQYLPAEKREAGRRVLEAAGAKATADAPLAHLQMEADDQPKDGAALTLQVWPSGRKEMIGRADFHGRWVRWFGWPKP